MAEFKIRLRRSLLDRVLGGVCGGIGELLGISAWWVRGVFAALLLTSAAFALMLYLLLWVSLPGQRLADVYPLSAPDAQRPLRIARPEGVLTVGALAVIVGVITLADQTGVLRATGGGNLLPPLMLLLIALIVLLKHLRGVA